MDARTRDEWIGLTLIGAACISACAKPPPAPAPVVAAAPPPIYEEQLQAVGQLDMEILDLNETPTPNRKAVVLSGTLVNRGTRATREVYIRVEALDTNGAVVLSADSQPSTATIGPGGRGTFAVTMENRPNVDRYHVEAIAK